jgi:hypothetical protein
MIVCAHTRTGTHLLAKLLHLNFETGVVGYQELLGSHSVLPLVPYATVVRPVLPVMLSIWRTREQLGIARSVSFSRMLRTPWPEMPASESCTALLNGVRVDRVRRPRAFSDTLPHRWLRVTSMFVEGAAVVVRYSDMVEQPLRVLGLFDLPRRGARRIVLERVGWTAVAEEQPKVDEADILLLQEYQEMLCDC